MALDERSGQLGSEVGQRRVRFDLLGSRMDAYFAPIAFDIADPARLDKHYPASKPNAQGLARVGLEPLERAAQRVVQVVLRERLYQKIQMLCAVHARAVFDEAGDVDHLRAAPCGEIPLHEVDAVRVFRAQLDIHHENVNGRFLRKTRRQRFGVDNMLDGELAATRGAFDHAPDDLGLGGIVFYYYDLVHGIG